MLKNALVALGALLTVSACGEPTLEVNVPLAVVNLSPHDGAVGIDPLAKPVVCFNRDMDPALVAGFVALEDEAGAVVGEAASASTNPRCLVVEHSGLEADSGYRVRLSQGLRAADGSELAVEIVSRFRTAR
jgi:hypothetical protein